MNSTTTSGYEKNFPIIESANDKKVISLSPDNNRKLI